MSTNGVQTFRGIELEFGTIEKPCVYPNDIANRACVESLIAGGGLTYRALNVGAGAGVVQTSPDTGTDFEFRSLVQASANNVTVTQNANDITFDLANTTVTPGVYAYPSSITFDAKGRATSATAGSAPTGYRAVSVGAGAAVVQTSPDTGPDFEFRSLVQADPANVTVTASATEVTFDLADTAVTPGTYDYATVTFDAKGRATSASSNTPYSEVTVQFDVTAETTNRSTTWVVPATVKDDTVYITMWAGGGGGAGGSLGYNGSGGGSGAAVVNFPFKVVAGETLDVVIGGGGLGDPGFGNTGGNSSVTGTSPARAIIAGGGGRGEDDVVNGGGGGAVDVTGNPSGPNGGGSATGSTFLNAPNSIDTALAGPAHAVNNGWFWAGAGSGGTTGAVSSSGDWFGRSVAGATNAGTGGAAGYNGNGGAGGIADTVGSNAPAASGAGGGGGGGGGSLRSGGNGGAGRVLIRYVVA